MNKNLYININILQTVPASCINRDDTGSPKTCLFGGVRRARVSSQAWKKVVRDEFKNTLSSAQVGVRSLKGADLIASEIQKIDNTISNDNAIKMALGELKSAGISVKEAKTAAMLFMSHGQAEALAKTALFGSKNKNERKKECQEALKEKPAIDIALFGRMVADDPSLNFDAACQVAHAISTHGIETEFDYFTACDDLQSEDQSGAGHLGVNEFNSSTLYRYADIGIRELHKNLGSQTPDAVAAFVKAFITTMPTGKSNSYANRTLPYFIYVTIRDDQPISLAGAFEEPVVADGEGNEIESEKKLANYAKEVYSCYGKPLKTFVSGTMTEPAELGEKLTLNELIAKLTEELEALLKDEVQ